MTWVVYNSADESTQIFVGIILILAITVIVGANIYFWVSDKIKNSKQK